jgi:hypothetical protein
VESSKRFLCCYSKFPKNSHATTESIVKGKSVILESLEKDRRERPPKPPDKVWLKPPVGWIKLSINSSFKVEDGTAGCGMILRDVEGNIIFRPAVPYYVVLKLPKQRCLLIMKVWS